MYERAQAQQQAEDTPDANAGPSSTNGSSSDSAEEEVVDAEVVDEQK